MPAIDRCEPQVIRALEKSGWVVSHQSYGLKVGSGKEKSYVFADLRLIQGEEEIIIVEVKCFADPRFQMDDLYQSIGQCVVYRNALRLNKIEAQLYLAVSEAVYQTFFQKPLVRAALADAAMKIVVVDLSKEEIRSWIDYATL
jgi:hypothetical protein